MSFLYTTTQIRQLEQNAIENSITADMMMQKAGGAVLQTIIEHWPNITSIIAFCGTGNNGGDGYVVARLAHEKGINVEVRHLGELSKLKNEALYAMQACEKQGVTIKPFDASESLTADILVDALLGIGLKGQVKQNYAKAIDYLNNSAADIISVDIPSGINADTGAVLGNAVIANCTVTFIGIKSGLLTGNAPDYCGNLICDNLDIPQKLFAEVNHQAEIIAVDDYENNFIPRALTANKGNFGHVLVIGGDYGMSGAPYMAASAAARVGAGMLTIATRPEHATVLNITQPELMCRGIKTAKELVALIKTATVIAIGPGLGQSVWGQLILKITLKHVANKPLVVDADALNLLAKNPHLILDLREKMRCEAKASEKAEFIEINEHFERAFNKADRFSRKSSWILTPHPAEAARLLKTKTHDIQNDRFDAITAIQKKYGGICVLKGAGSLIYDGENPIKICTAGNPGMASGGMGDVLTGIIAGLVAQGIPLATAAECGVCLHAEAADYVASISGERGLLATDLLPYLQRLVNL